jgi:hypothetical protein
MIKANEQFSNFFIPCAKRAWLFPPTLESNLQPLFLISIFFLQQKTSFMKYNYQILLKNAILGIAIILGLGFSLSLNAQTKQGSVSGKIIDKGSSEDLIGATVQVDGSDNGTVTDIEGKFDLSLNPGTYTLVCSYISYQTQKIQVEVKAGQVTFLNVVMDEEVNALQEVVVTYTVQKSSALALLTERKNSAQVSDGVSADLIRKTPDRTTSDVLKRVTGASIQEGKFAVIRGMNDRYNAGYLDGALLPSTESDRKAFAFDVVPASLLDNLQIIKAGTPDLIGDFGGGIIKINTKAIPEEFTQTISVGLQTHSLTSFKDFFQFKRYSGESLNFPSSQRDLPSFADNGLKSPSTFPSAALKQQFAGITQNFNNDWSNQTLKAGPNTRFSYSLGFPIRLSGNRKIGVIFAVNYANTRRFSKGVINSFDGAGQVSNFNDNIYLQNFSTGGILNVNYVAGKTQINFRNLLNANTDNNAISRSGIANISDNLLVHNYANLINYSRLYNTILSLKQLIGESGLTLNASLNYSSIVRNVPDYRIVNYSNPDPADVNGFRLATGDFFNTSSGRFYSNLNESLTGGTLELSKQLKSAQSRTKTELKAGFFYQSRNRDFSSRSFVYNGNPPSSSQNPATDLGASTIGASKLYLVEKTSDDIAYYTGKSNLTAFYGMVDQKFFEKLRAVYGLRYEYIDINVTNQKINTAIARIKQGVALPSANFSYSLTEKSNLRAAYYASVNRPEFRELAPFSFYVFDRNAEIRGNKNLQIAKLNNFDLRWEFYPSGSQIVSVGAFYKSILNPVEFSIDITQPFTTFTFENEKSAKVYGLEFEVRKNFDFLAPTGKETGFFHDLVFFSNLALIKSRLNFSPGSQAKNDRPLQGQSPYVINIGLQYENSENGWFASAIFNRVGRRIAFVGVDPKFGDTRQDIYEQPRSVIDFQVGKKIGKLNVKFTLGDALKKNLVYYQDTNNDKKYNPESDRTMFKFTNGYTGNLAVSYTF